MIYYLVNKIKNRAKLNTSPIPIKKLAFITLFGFGLISVITFAISIYNTSYETIYRERIEKIKYISKFVREVLIEEDKNVMRGEKTLKEAQSEAIKIVSRLRFEKNDYIWIDTFQSKQVYHPYPQTRGNIGPKYIDVKSFIIDMKMVELAKIGGGYLKYYWTKPDEPLKNTYPKVSYILPYKKWDWIVGTGVYIDDIKDIVLQSMIQGIIPVIIVCILLFIIFRYLIWTSIVDPIDELAERSLKLANNELTEPLPEIKSQSEFSKLYKSFNKFVESYVEKKDNEEKLSLILNNMSDALIISDVLGNIISSNPAVYKLFGVTQEDIIGTNVDRYTHPSLFSGNPEDFEGIKYFNDKYELMGKKNENYFPIEVDVNEIPVGDKNLFFLLIRNISAQKEIDKIKSEFLHLTGTELKNPILEIRDILKDILKRPCIQESAYTKNILTKAYCDSTTLIDLINQIVDIEKIIEGTLEFDFKITNANEIIEEIISENIHFAQKKEINIEYINNLPLGTSIEIDRNRFTQIMSNLLTNAVKHSPKNSKVYVSASVDKRFVHISVKDHGSGISEEFKEHIFEIFSSQSSPNIEDRKGVGMGLYITKNLIAGMNGTIKFDSEPGKWTVFDIHLPIAETKIGEQTDESQ